MSGSVIPSLSNSEARRLFLHKHGLGSGPRGPGKGDDLLKVFDELGFVQVDSINTVARAHHMILAARRPAYKEKNLKRLLEKERQLFEHWTHDAAIVPTAFFPHWRLRFERDRTVLMGRWRNWRRDGFEEKFNDVLKHISDHGEVTSSTVGKDEERRSGGWWDWHPSKTALEFLWRTGQISVSRRQGFQKVYDLTERVIPPEHLQHRFELEETIDWAAYSALSRLGFATSGEIAAFWDLISPAEAKQWCSTALQSGRIIEADVACTDGKQRRVFLFPETLEELAALVRPPERVRILSPFDPALRDRKRAERLFGFSYRIEIFVPEAQRQYGYYVFPVLEGDTLIGRIDMKANRDSGCLAVRAFWPEPGIKMGKGRRARLQSEIDRWMKFSGCANCRHEDNWLKNQI